MSIHLQTFSQDPTQRKKQGIWWPEHEPPMTWLALSPLCLGVHRKSFCYMRALLGIPTALCEATRCAQNMSALPSSGRPWKELRICMHSHGNIWRHCIASQQMIPLHNHLLLRLDELSTRMTSESVEKIRVCMRWYVHGQIFNPSQTDSTTQHISLSLLLYSICINGDRWRLCIYGDRWRLSCRSHFAEV